MDPPYGRAERLSGLLSALESKGCISGTWNENFAHLERLSVLKGSYRFQSNICSYPDGIFFRESLAYVNMTMLNRTLHLFPSRSFIVGESGCWTGPPADRLLISWTHVEHQEVTNRTTQTLSRLGQTRDGTPLLKVCRLLGRQRGCCTEMFNIVLKNVVSLFKQIIYFLCPVLSKIYYKMWKSLHFVSFAFNSPDFFFNWACMKNDNSVDMKKW